MWNSVSHMFWPLGMMSLSLMNQKPSCCCTFGIPKAALISFAMCGSVTYPCFISSRSVSSSSKWDQIFQFWLVAKIEVIVVSAGSGKWESVSAVQFISPGR